MDSDEEITDTNYFDYMVKQQADELKLLKLQKEKRLKEKNETLTRIKRMTNTIIRNNKAIEKNCEFVRENENWLLKSDQEQRDYIYLAYEEHKRLKRIISGMQEIFEKPGLLNDVSDINDKHVQEYIGILHRECKEVKITYNNCVGLGNDLQELLTKLDKEEEKDECPALSESTIHTFQFTNLSASSPNM